MLCMEQLMRSSSSLSMLFITPHAYNCMLVVQAALCSYARCSHPVTEGMLSAPCYF